MYRLRVYPLYVCLQCSEGKVLAQFVIVFILLCLYGRTHKVPSYETLEHMILNLTIYSDSAGTIFPEIQEYREKINTLPIYGGVIVCVHICA